MAEIRTTPVRVESGCLIQNLGPDPIYVGESSFPLNTGIRIEAGYSLVVGHSNNHLFVMSESFSDVRVLHRATGIFQGDIPS